LATIRDQGTEEKGTISTGNLIRKDDRAACSREGETGQWSGSEEITVEL
jgi:hypothetical protein